MIPKGFKGFNILIREYKGLRRAGNYSQGLCNQAKVTNKLIVEAIKTKVRLYSYYSIKSLLVPKRFNLV